MKYRIGIYGGMGCGKSTVSDRLRRLGADVLDADKLNAELPALPAYIAGVRALCPACLAGGVFDKKALRRWVLESEENRQALMALAHPMIRRIIEDRTREGLWFVEISVYTEGFIDFDESWHVVCAPEVQMARILTRGGWSRAEAAKMIKAQGEEGLAPADAVLLVNDGSLVDLEAQVDALYEALRARLEER